VPELLDLRSGGDLFATQFHPERSGDARLQIHEYLVKTVSSA
jgi:imidazoleglycerol phosphate synthase glutamine amidotransferase subunit HisH